MSMTIEQTILGACLEKPKLINHFTEVKPEYFTSYPFQELWRLLLDWHWKDKAIYPPALLPIVSTWFAGEDRQQEASSFLTNLMMLSFPLKKKDCEDYIKTLEEGYLSKGVNQSIKEALEALKTGYEASTVIGDLQKSLWQLRGKLKTTQDVESIGQASDMALRALDERIKGVAPKAISTGFGEIDRSCGGGLHKGGLVMVGGATGMGKTVMALTLAWNMVLDGAKCLYFNLEMKTTDMIDRLISAHASIKSLKIRKGDVSAEEFGRYHDTVEEMRDLPFYICSPNGITIDQILMMIREQYHTRGVDVVVIDYIQIVKSIERRERRDQELADMALSLSNIAKELGISVVVLAQLNEDVSKRENNRPTLSDIRESKSMGHSCENVWLLFREEYYHDKRRPSETRMSEFFDWKDNAEKIQGKAEVIIAKNRHGYITSVPVRFEGEYVRFVEQEN
jgi:replicative DNA helicase